MKIAYLDCFAGISGDMVLGALVDLGFDPSRIDQVLESLGVDGYSISVRDEQRASIGGKRVEVSVSGEQPHRHLRHLEEILERGELDDAVRARARDVFRRLTEAEARVHRQPVEKVHLHEVGAVDAIVDVVGACLGFDALGIDRIVCSPIVVGRGMTRGQHGPIPVPGPATLELLGGVPIRQGPVVSEMTTPTGAALAVVLADEFGAMPDVAITAVGYGCGARSFDELPNMLRIVIGEASRAASAETVNLLEANIDDMTPEVLGHALSRLLGAGALDAWVAPVVMKKGRPGHVLSVLARTADADRMAKIMFRETSTIGIRQREIGRRVLDRRHDEVDTAYGKVRVKVALDGSEILNAAPEFDDCVRLAQASGVPVTEVQAAALVAWRGLRG